MKIFSYFLLTMLTFQLSTSCMITGLSDVYPIEISPIENTFDVGVRNAGFGVWSRYVPLSNVEQIGNIGILDSSCFHLFRIEDKTNNQLHFLGYDCIDYGNKTIKKYFLFLDKNGGDIQEESLIDYTQYEFIWHFQGFYTNPQEQQVLILIWDSLNQLYQKTISLEFPYEKQNLNLIVGGDFIVSQNVPLYTFENHLLSYFPGQVYYFFGCFQSDPGQFTYMIESIDNLACVCKTSQITSIADVTIEKQNIYEFVSQQPHCQQFLLSGWVKIREIYTSENEFDFQLIKLSGNFQHPQLIEQNLCAFQLFYKISSNRNKIIITTYSYTFPAINIDFSSNPFLKSEVFDVTFDIQLWHYILVKKLENSISISITFYKGFDKEELNINLDVAQFNNVQFKLLYGNIFQSKSKYLTISIVGLQFFNCPDNNEPSISCHPTCLECDGPTKDDCLSCFKDSNRRYLPNFKQCICEYGTIDVNNECVDYEVLKLKLTQEKPQKEKCKYGFFEFEGNCFQCPSIVNVNVITCLECVQNPKEWAQTLICQTTLYTDKDGNVSQQLKDSQLYYKFVGSDLQYCPDCKTISSTYDLVEKIEQFKNFCQISQSINTNCYQCGEKCDECQILPTHLNCLTVQDTPHSRNPTCEPPNFMDFQKKCVACKIKNCLYCFNYLASDPTKTTLGFQDDYSFNEEEINNGSFSLINEEIKEGCAQCVEEYIFDFTIGDCIFKTPSQENCLRSFINQQNYEICTLSAINDFNIALEITNCQSHILNCKQCLKTPQSTLKCLLCDDYFKVSTSTGVCSICTDDFSKQCFEDNFLEPWKWYVQGFTIQFLPNKPIFTMFVQGAKTIITQCISGYQKIKGNCYPYCDQMCSECKDIDFSFQCSKCKLNYYQETIRNQFDGKCFQCSSLCQVCEIRASDEIDKINPYFIITPENTIHTFKCLQQIPLQQVQIDPNFQIALYCYENGCINSLELYYDNTDCNEIQNIHSYLTSYYNYQYFNHIGLKEISLNLKLKEECNFYKDDYILSNDYKESIFSLQLTRLNIQGPNNPVYLADQYSLTIKKFDFVILTNQRFYISLGIVLQFQNSGQPIDLQVIDTQFYSINSNPVSFSIKGDGFLNLILKNLSIFDLNIENSVAFNIYCIDLRDIMIIEDFKLQNCNFINSTLFLFQNAQRSVLIKNITIDSCNFYNSSIAHFILNQDQFSNIIIDGVQIKNSLFQNTSFIYSKEKTTFSINNLSILKNRMMNLKFMTFNYESNFKDILIKDNDLISFQFISQISSIIEKYEIQLNQIEIQRNSIQDFQIFVTEQKQSITQINVLLNNFYFEDNIISSYQEKHFIIINCFNLTIQNTFITNTLNYRFLSLLSIPMIKLENVVYENSIQEQKIQMSLECLKNQILHSQLLQVNGFINITLNKIQLKNLFSIDQSIISIQSNPLIMLNTNEYIKIKNLMAIGNILVKQQLGKIFSIIELQSEKPQIIEIDNLIFEENIFHQYNKDPSETSASLFYVDSGQGLLTMKNIICFNNSLTNSSLSFISIFSNEVQIEKFQVQNHNYHDQEFWIKYYNIQIQGNFNQNEITYIISQTYNIETIGGALSITVTKFQFSNGLFNFIRTQGSQVFNIDLQGDGIVIIQNCSVNHAYNSLISNYEQDGAFTINGKKSLLAVYVNNITLSDVLNKITSSIFSIYPSSSQNSLELKNIFARDCFSLVDQILNFKSDFQNILQSTVKIDNFTIISTEKAFLTFLQSIQINLIERQKILTENAIMNFAGCKLTLNQIKIEGIILSPIIKIMDSKYVKILNTKLINIQTFYPLNLVDVQQSNVMQSKIHFSNITISNQFDFNFNNLNQNQFNYQYINLYSSQCNLRTVQIIQQIDKQDLALTFFDDIFQNSNQNGSLIKMKSITNQTRIFFSQVLLLNNNCQYCLNGLIYLELIDFENAKISELSCMMNSLKNYGCILAKSDKNIDSIISILNSNFISNNGQQGGGVFIENIKLYLKNSIFFNNTASQKGGGFYFSEGSQRFTIKSSLIYNNQAAEAGGIYLAGNSFLNQNNFISSLLLFNFAKQSSNNINELPRHLGLSINLIEMFSQEKLIEGRLYQVLQLKPYKIISQDHTKSTNYLFIPSGQQVSNYEFYNPKHEKYQPYIFDFSILLKNSMNEQLINFQNTTCNIEQKIFDNNSQQIIESIRISKITFNQDTKGFNLGSLQFDIDPYNQENRIQEILVYCNSSFQEDQLAYRMRVQSFMCKLGEFYIYAGCQICQPLQGFYSVTYNTTKCSIFDKNKFDAITSNKIQLKPEFWRPNQISDYVELCFKNPTYCEGGWKFGNDLCSQGHIGGLCEECDRYNIRGAGQFFKDQKQLECKQCQDFSRLLLTFFLISIWYNKFNHLGLSFPLYQPQEVLKDRINYLHNLRFDNNLLKFYSNQIKVTLIMDILDHESILLKLFLNYLWIFCLIFTFNIRFSFSLNVVKQSNDTSYYMANYFECILAEIQGIELIYSRILVMFVLLVGQILIIYIGFKVASILKKTKFKIRVISITILYLYIQNYASLINQFFSILAVRKISNLNYISGDVSLLYGSQSHIIWIKGFAIPGSSFIGLIIPLLLFLILYFNRENHNKIKFRRHVGYLFNEYTQKNYFWEMIKLWKKTIIIIILIYFETDIFLKATLLGLCLLFYQLIALKYKPFILKVYNELDIQSGQYCSITIFFAVVKYICEQSEQYNISELIQNFIIFMSIILSYPFIIHILKVYYNKYKLLVLASLFQGFKAFKANFKFTKFLGEKLSQLRQKEDKTKRNIQKLKSLLFSKKIEGRLQQINVIFSGPTSITQNSIQKKKQISLILDRNFNKEI